jgi:hypothetical protein
MAYTASEGLTALINKVRKIATINFFGCALIILIYTPILYKTITSQNIWVFLLIEISLIFLMGLIDRSRTLSMVANIKKLVTEVEIFDEYLIIKTAPVKVLLWANKPSQEIKFIRHEFIRNKVSFPVKQIYDLDKAWKLSSGKNEVFILTDYFDIEFVTALEDFLYWKDIPPQYKFMQK